MSESEKVPVKELLKLIELGKVREPELDKFIDKLQEFADPRLQNAIKTTESNMQRFFNSFAEAGKSLWDEGGFKEAFNKILLGTKWLTNKNSPLLYIGRMFTNILAGLTKSALDRFAKFADLMVKFKVFKDPTKTGEYFSLNDDWDKGFLDFIDNKFPKFSDEFRKFFDAEGMDKVRAFGDILSAVWDETTKDAFPELKTFLENVELIVKALAIVSKALLDFANSEAMKTIGRLATRIPDLTKTSLHIAQGGVEGITGAVSSGTKFFTGQTPKEHWEDIKTTNADARSTAMFTLYKNALRDMHNQIARSQLAMSPVGLSPVAKSVIEVKLQLNDNALDVMMAKITGDLVSTITTK